MGRIHYMLSFSAVMLIAATVDTSAQAPGDEDIVGEDIIVEGELQTRTLQDTTTSVSVFQGSDLDQSADVDLYDVLEGAPNVTSAFGEKGFTIRGIDQRGPAGGNGGLVISTSVDGASIANNQATFFGPYSTCDLEQIEVLRGPQSTQQGRNALAGAIILRSNDPTYDFEVKGRAEVAARQTGGGCAAVNIPIIDDTVALRVAGELFHTDGFVRNPTLNDNEYDARDQKTFRAKLRLDPTDNLSIIATGSYYENFGGEDFVQAASFPGSRLNFSNVKAEEGSIHEIYGVRMVYDIDDAFSIESETTYYHNDYTRLEDSDGSPANGGFLGRVATFDSFEQDLRLRYEGEQIDAVLGAYFTRNENVQDAGGQFDGSLFMFPTGSIVTLDLDSEREETNFAVFGEVEYRPIPELALIAGLRWDYEEADQLDTQNRTVTLGGFVLGATMAQTQTSTSFNAFLPKLGVVYDWTDDLSTGFTVQRGYRSGGAQLNGSTGVLNEFDPEYTWNFEGSVRSKWFDDRLTANANVFYTIWQDQQLSLPGPANATDPLDFNTVNAGESRLFGGELELQFSPNDNIEVYAGVGYTNTEFTDFQSTAGNFNGNRFQFASEWTASFGGTYFFDNGLQVGADATFTGDAFSDAANTAPNRIGSRFLVNAKVGYQEEDWGLFIFARNLFDEDYIYQTDGLLGSQVRTGEPLTVGAIFTLDIN